MEFDILNGVLTQNVEKLFSHRPIYNFRKNTPSINDRNLIISYILKNNNKDHHIRIRESNNLL